MYKIGMMQGRLTTPKDNRIQFFPIDEWTAEFLAYRVRRLKHMVTDTLEIQPGDDIEEQFNIRSVTDLDEALASPIPHPIFCGQTPLDTQNPSSYNHTMRKQCLINIIRRFVLGFPP